MSLKISQSSSSIKITPEMQNLIDLHRKQAAAKLLQTEERGKLSETFEKKLSAMARSHPLDQMSAKTVERLRIACEYMDAAVMKMPFADSKNKNKVDLVVPVTAFHDAADAFLSELRSVRQANPNVSLECNRCCI